MYPWGMEVIRRTSSAHHATRTAVSDYACMRQGLSDSVFPFFVYCRWCIVPPPRGAHWRIIYITCWRVRRRGASLSYLLSFLVIVMCVCDVCVCVCVGWMSNAIEQQCNVWYCISSCETLFRVRNEFAAQVMFLAPL